MAAWGRGRGRFVELGWWKRRACFRYVSRMSTDEIVAVIANAIKSEVAHPLGAMRHLPASEEEVALTVLNALDEAGFEVVRREQRSSS